MAQGTTDLEHHRDLGAGRYFMIERLDRVQKWFGLTNNAGDFVCARDRHDMCPCIDLRTFDECWAHAIDQRVCDQCCEYLPTQAMTGYQSRVTLSKNRGKISLRINLKEVLESFLGVDEAVVQVDFRVAQNYRNFRPCQTFLVAATFVYLCLMRQELEVAIEQTTFLEVSYQARRLVDTVGRHRLSHADSLRLQIVVPEHESGHVIRHRREQLVALLARHSHFLRDIAKKDLDVDLSIRAVDTRRVINEICINAPAVLAVLYSRALRESEVATLTNDFAP